MSIQAVAWVLEEAKAEKSARLVLFALANHADAHGERAFPAVATIAREARLSERAVQAALRKLIADGEIERTGTTRSGTFIYRIRMGGAKSAGGAEIVPPTTKSAPEPSVNRQPSLRSGCGGARASADVKFGGKPVNAESWELAQAVLREFNRHAGTKLRALKSSGQPSEAAKRVYGRVREYPDITLPEHEDIIRRTLASRWWGSEPPTIGVVFGPLVFEDNITRQPTPAKASDRGGKISAAFERARKAAEELREDDAA